MAVVIDHSRALTAVPVIVFERGGRQERSSGLRIRGHLDPAWTVWFDDLTLTQNDDGTTELVGPLSDQSALYGLLARLRDLGATLLLVEQLLARSRTGKGHVNDLEQSDFMPSNVRLEWGDVKT